MPATQHKIIRRQHPSPVPDYGTELHPVVAAAYAARNVQSARELDYALAQLPPPNALLGMEVAVDLLFEAIAGDARILVVGDFDADGATSCALAFRAITSLGGGNVGYLVPNRFAFGYGLTPEIVEVAAQQTPDLIITVDNGISSLEGVLTAQDYGMTVLVTDHHLPGQELPRADAIVNPNQPGDGFPSKNIAGVGVIFYVMLGLRARMRAEGWFGERDIPEPNLAELLDLVALGTVADVVPLDRINRTFVAQGLARINADRTRPGLLALLEIGNRTLGRVVAADLAFAVGPRLNAAGRLEDMTLGIECLLSDSTEAASVLAARLDELNRARRNIETDMQTQALAALEDLQIDAEATRLPKGLCLFDEQWHQGVIGILASRMRERTHRPVIAFAPAGEAGEELKGSARSVPGLHIRDALDAIAVQHPDLIQKFGGHAMAAGLSLARDNYEPFCAAFATEVARHLSDDDLQGVILSDGELAADRLDMALGHALRAGGPWGQAFPEPVFDGVFEVVNERVVGEKHLKLVLKFPDNPTTFDAIAFNRAADGKPSGVARVRTAYRVDVNQWQGNEALQLIIEHMEPC